MITTKLAKLEGNASALETSWRIMERGVEERTGRETRAASEL